MPLNTEGPPTNSRQEFCLALKASRERKGITLDQIAETTKIPASVFAALERNDLRRWPKGLFRRSFFRDYARTIGLPVAEACAEFVRLFPDHDGAELIPTTAATHTEGNPTNDVRLVLDPTWHGPRVSVPSRLLAALCDAGAVVLVAVALAWVAGAAWSTTTAVVALAYFSLATALAGESPATWAIPRRRSILDALMHGPAAIATAWTHASDSMSQLFGNAGGGAPESSEEPASRPWVSDARRVGPPRLRVRIKLS